MNFWILNPSVFKYLHRDFNSFIVLKPENTDKIYLPAVIDSFIKNKEVIVSAKVSPEKWKEVTYTEDKAELQEFLKQKIKDNIYTEDYGSKNNR